MRKIMLQTLLLGLAVLLVGCTSRATYPPTPTQPAGPTATRTRPPTATEPTPSPTATQAPLPSPTQAQAEGTATLETNEDTSAAPTDVVTEERSPTPESTPSNEAATEQAGEATPEPTPGVDSWQELKSILGKLAQEPVEWEFPYAGSIGFGYPGQAPALIYKEVTRKLNLQGALSHIIQSGGEVVVFLDDEVLLYGLQSLRKRPAYLLKFRKGRVVAVKSLNSDAEEILDRYGQRYQEDIFGLLGYHLGDRDRTHYMLIISPDKHQTALLKIETHIIHPSQTMGGPRLFGFSASLVEDGNELDGAKKFLLSQGFQYDIKP
ncbi:MAG: hypothetical protein GXO36_05190 [Chloroflexi bacterium]|nr:hypothetical protein [Chloroflexota bacterium]